MSSTQGGEPMDTDPPRPKKSIWDEGGHVGLVNQAMTCYLNSLLQTLYMSPEFRNAIYRTDNHDESTYDVSKNIPHHLQKLFVLLQTTDTIAVETKDITRSFGWESSDAYQQHDVQELMRVMFDALEKRWKKNPKLQNFINDLYQGELKDYVTCSKCNHESARTDTFLDISLTIKPFGAERSYSSIEECLQAYVEPETLQGNNQYFCEKCKKKTDAKKGLKFTKFPYFLTMQLKRFDFDYETMRRIKLNDRVSFPEVLNLNHLIDKEGQKKGGFKNPFKSDKSKPKYDKYDDGYGGLEADSNYSHTQNEPGKYVYELFSVMIHSDVQQEVGHYYAYIKSFRDRKWYSFDDELVSQINVSDVKKTYGGGHSGGGYYSRDPFGGGRDPFSGGYGRHGGRMGGMGSSHSGSNAAAYMLMYRRIDKSKNENFICKTHLSDEWTQVLKRLKDKEDEEQELKDFEENAEEIRMFCHVPGEKKKRELKIKIHRKSTFEKATDKVYKVFGLEKLVPRNCVRLVKYDYINDFIDSSFDGQEKEPYGKVMENSAYYYADMLLEIKSPEETFEKITPGNVGIRIVIVDVEAETQTHPIPARAPHETTVGELKQLICDTLKKKRGLNYKPADLFFAQEVYRDFVEMHDDSKNLRQQRFFKTSRVYLDDSGKGHDVPFKESRLYALLDRFQNLGTIEIILPPYANELDKPWPEYAYAGRPGPEKLSKYTKEEEEVEQKGLTRYFSAELEEDKETKERKVIATLDTRITAPVLRKNLEKYVGVPAYFFRLFRTVPDMQNMELTKVTDDFRNYSDKNKVIVKLGRALLKDEVRAKIFKMQPDAEEPYVQILDDTVIGKTWNVLDAKKSFAWDLERYHNITIPAENIRLRRKAWKSAGIVYVNTEEFKDEEIYLPPVSDFFVQILKEPEPVTEKNSVVFFARHWKPSKLKLGPHVDVIMTEKEIELGAEFLREKLHEMSGIPVENLQFGRNQQGFPKEISVLEVDKSIDWEKKFEKLDIFPCKLMNGDIVIYRDKTEPLMQLEPAKRQELQQQENIRVGKYNRDPPSIYSYSRGEQALKIQ